MPDEYEVRFHPEFFNDLKRLEKNDLEAAHKQVKKIKENPTRFKRLHGKENCYTIRVGKLRIVYYLEGRTIWFLTVEKRDKVYAIYFKRLYSIRQRLE